MESRFGRDFSRVRVHADTKAAESASAISASAYTVGPNIVFGAGRYEPHTARGGQLLAHELTHTIQQRMVDPDTHDLALGTRYGRAEEEAQRAADGVRQTFGTNRIILSARSNNLQGAGGPAWSEMVVASGITALENPALIQRQPIDLPKATPTGKIGDMDVLEFDIEPSNSKHINMKISNERESPDYVDNRVEAVGFGIYLSGCYLYVSGIDTPVYVPDSQINLAMPKATAVNQSVYPSRDAALAAVPKDALVPTYAFYRAVGGLSVPTVFSEATAPRVMATLRAAKVQLAEEVQRDLTVLALSLVGGMLVRGIVNKIMKIGTGPSKMTKASPPVESAPPGKPGMTNPPSGIGKGPQVIESAGASPKGGQFQSASAKTTKSMATAIRADIGESEAYKAALTKGEIGLERPQGTNVAGRGDFVTARKMPNGDYEIIVTDVKTRTTETSKFPKPKVSMPSSWGEQVRGAISPDRLKLGDPAVEKAIVDAANKGRIWSRQVNVDYSPTGGGSITGF